MMKSTESGVRSRTQTLGHPRAEPLYQRIEELLSSPIRDEADAAVKVQKGFSYKSLKNLSQYAALIPLLVAAESTLRRRRETKSRFSMEESERLLRIARVIALAEETFGDPDSAKRWLKSPKRLLPDSPPISPLELARTDPGARLIEERLLRTVHGVF